MIPPSRVLVESALSEAYPRQDGVPQGSMLSFTLFAVAINGVIDVVSDIHFHRLLENLCTLLTSWKSKILRSMLGFIGEL